jgi:hypothetical protein
MTNFLIGIGVPKLYAGDVALFLMMILAGIVLIFIAKKTKLGAFSYAIYAAYFLTEVLYFDFVKGYLLKAMIFLGMAFGLHYLLFKPTVVVKLGGKSAVAKWLRRILVAFLIVGFVATIILGWMPAKEVKDLLSPLGRKIFVTDFARLVWAVLPLFVLAVIRKKD